MSIKDYINACNANIKANKKTRAKKAFDLAWKEYASGNYDDTDEKFLFWLRGNFYVDGCGCGYCVSDEADYYENAILASAGL